MYNNHQHNHNHQAHHLKSGFRNPTGEPTSRQDVRRWKRERKAQHLPRPPAKGYSAFIKEWWQAAEITVTGNRVWWLGHATILLYYQGIWILTDPIFSQRASPVSFAGPKRRTPIAISIEELPPIDVVLISHNHYDHLDRSSIVQLKRCSPEVKFLVPLKVAHYLTKWGIERSSIDELDWWQHSAYRSDITFICTPAQHWSKRTLWDDNRSLWCGWVIQFADFRFYFAGDTAYSTHLLPIKALGPFDLAAIPIGAYEPRWLMKAYHLAPMEAVQLHQQLGCKCSIAIHWATFELTDESLDEPPQRLLAALTAHNLAPAAFRLLKIGGSFQLAKTE